MYQTVLPVFLQVCARCNRDAHEKQMDLVQAIATHMHVHLMAMCHTIVCTVLQTATIISDSCVVYLG